MLRLRPFEWKTPKTVEETISLLMQHGKSAHLYSGGSDLIPNLKLWQMDAQVVISLANLPNGKEIALQDNTIQIGGMVTLHAINQHPLIQKHLPVLAQAVSRIASPQIRRQGTLVGNLVIKSRCRYINQSELFREALGGCLRSHGNECHVIPGGGKCVAALSSDSVPVLISLGTTLVIAGPKGQRTIPLHDLHQQDGCNHLSLSEGEFILRILVPLPPQNSYFVYRKWAVRKSIDFPLVSVAVRLDVDDTQTLKGGVVVVGAIGPKARMISLDQFQDSTVDGEMASAIGQLVRNKCKPLPNIPYDDAYRRIRLGVESKRAVLAIEASLSGAVES